MKKLFIMASLLVAATSSWVVYGSQAEPSAGYMMIISRFSGNGFNSKGSITTIVPNGQTQTQEIETKNGTINKVTASLDQLTVSELKTLNELRAAGWRVKTVTPLVLGSGAVTETVYLLEKE